MKLNKFLLLPFLILMLSSLRGMMPTLQLRAVVIGGDVKLAEKFIVAGANVNAVTSNGATLLMMAVDTNSSEMVRLLLEKGAKVDAFGGAALGMALEKDNIALVTALIEGGADIDSAAARWSGEHLRCALLSMDSERVYRFVRVLEFMVSNVSSLRSLVCVNERIHVILGAFRSMRAGRSLIDLIDAFHLLERHDCINEHGVNKLPGIRRTLENLRSHAFSGSASEFLFGRHVSFLRTVSF